MKFKSCRRYSLPFWKNVIWLLSWIWNECDEPVPLIVGIGEGLNAVDDGTFETEGGFEAAAANEGVAFVESLMEENLAEHLV